MEGLVALFIPIAVSVVLPIMIVWLVCRKSINETNKRTEIAIAAINNNQDVNLEELLKQTAKPQKTIKEKLMSMLQSGCICTGVGLALMLCVLINCVYYGGMNGTEPLLYGGIITFFCGLALLITYFVSKKKFARECEACEKAGELQNN